MKVETKVFSPVVQPVNRYPCLGRNLFTGVVVLFWDHGQGTELSEGDRRMGQVGRVLTKLDMSGFEVIPGLEVTIKNQ